MAAFTSNDFTVPAFSNDTYTYYATANDAFNVAPIPYVAAYYETDAYYVVVQADRVLAALAATSVAGNYTIAGTAAPTVTAASFTPGNRYVRLTLSGRFSSGAYTLSLAERTLVDAANIYQAFPLVVSIYDASAVLQRQGFNAGYN